MTAKGTTLPKAYLRMSPNLDQHPDIEGMVRLLCAAARQSQRGRFTEKNVVVRAVGAGSFRRLSARGDIVTRKEGERTVWYVEGWDEWQEGDLTVGERQARIRDRKRSDGRDTDVTTSRTSNGRVTAETVTESRTSNAMAVTQPLHAPLHKRSSPSEAIDVRRTTYDESEGSTRSSSSRGARANGRVDPLEDPDTLELAGIEL